MVHKCTINGKLGYRYGETGTIFTYNVNDKASRKRAIQKAYAQGAAIEAGVHNAFCPTGKGGGKDNSCSSRDGGGGSGSGGSSGDASGGSTARATRRTKVSTAVTEYRQEIKKAQRNIDRVKKLLEDHTPRTLRGASDESQIHYGHVGDIGHVNEVLSQIVQFLSGEGG